MAYRLAILALFSAIIGLSTAQDTCNVTLLNNLVSCCPNMPRVLQKASFERCMPIFQETQNQYMAFESKTNSSTPRGGGMCMMKCVLYVQGLLTPDNKTDTAKIKAGLLSNISSGQYAEEWKTVVEKTIENATAEVAKTDYNAAISTIPEGVRICSPSYGMFMATVRRNLALACPGYRTDAVCQTNRAALLNCNPNRYINTSGRRAKTNKNKLQGKGARKSGKSKSASMKGKGAGSKTDASTQTGK